jgi:A/G-specific adenine glycosylase
LIVSSPILPVPQENATLGGQAAGPAIESQTSWVVASDEAIQYPLHHGLVGRVQSAPVTRQRWNAVSQRNKETYDRSYVVEERKREEVSRLLTRWYDPARRPFPWRDSSNVFYVTVCEVLLQRTNAEKVALAADELFRRYPTAQEMASADEIELARILQPLGLPRRVRHIQEIARAFASDAPRATPLGPVELAQLPGVGPYVLAAVKVLALGEPDAVIDEHVLRVLRRVFGVHAPARRHPTRALENFARSLVPAARARSYNLALLDLGRLVCRPNNPKCCECPLRRLCNYARSEGGAGDDCGTSE